MKRFLAAIALTLLAPAAASAAETTVDPTASGCAAGARCPTISAAIGVSSNGDTVRVMPGAYVENVDVNKDLTIDADPGAVILGPASGTPLTISAAGVDVLDMIVYKAANAPAVSVAATDARIGRSTIIGLGDGIVLAATTGARALTVDSTAVSAQGVAFRATTSLLGTTALTLNHVTAAKAGGAVALEGGGGNIAFTAKGSILHGASTATDTNLLPTNTITATYENSDATAMTGAATFAGNATPDDQLFGEGLLLKSTAPVIDKGGPVAGGESATDLQGDNRLLGSATDIGADEYINHAPKLTLALSKDAAGTSEIITGTATVTDLDGKTDVASVTIDWGDGTVDTGAAQRQHAYLKPGNYNVSATATDKAGATSDAASKSITVTDALAPVAQITSPKEGASVKLAGKLAKVLTIKGVDGDDGTVTSVEVAITRRAGGCAHYDGKTFVSAKCKQFKFVPANMTGFRFRLDTVKLKFTKGAYEVRVRATDAAGNKSTSFSKAAKSLVKFKVS
jgi:PKD repeat protein